MSREPVPTRRGPRPRFTRHEVLRTALRLIDTGPPGTFTMRALADEMGMGVMTLYGYVANRDELYEGVVALAFGEDPSEPDPDAPWERRVRDGVAALYGVCSRHPNLVPIALTDTFDPGLFRRRELILAALREAGFGQAEALRALGVLASYALGFAAAQGSALARLPESLRERSAEFPALAEAADTYPGHLSPSTFAYGLDLIVRGLREDLVR